ncbi:hypothetical protein V5799_019571 [Amblyomma americanum]|uniref:Uncharacterized protein n=1 Tax=Amblyomma americanum TaxID=6943 RepID=A0AAQ4EWD4_AMBAM
MAPAVLHSCTFGMVGFDRRLVEQTLLSPPQQTTPAHRADDRRILHLLVAPRESSSKDQALASLLRGSRRSEAQLRI